MAGRADQTGEFDPNQWRTAGERIETLLDALRRAGPPHASVPSSWSARSSTSMAQAWAASSR